MHYIDRQPLITVQTLGHVTVQIHTFLGDDLDKTREKARGPLGEYLQASFALKNTDAGRVKGSAVDIAQLPKEDLQYVFSGAFKDYVNSAGLIGTPDHCAPVVDKLIAAGVDELCCLIDFGVDLESTMESLHYVNELKKALRARTRAGNADGGLLMRRPTR